MNRDSKSSSLEKKETPVVSIIVRTKLVPTPPKTSLVPKASQPSGKPDEEHRTVGKGGRKVKPADIVL